MNRDLEFREFLPFTLSEQLAAICRDIDRLSDRLDSGGVVPRKWSGKLRRDLEAEAVAASTRIEGVNVSDDDVRRIIAGDRPVNVTDDDIELVNGYRDAVGFAQRRAEDASFEWSPELILGIHDRVSAGRRMMGAGQFRTDDGVVLRDRASGDVVFRPAKATDVPTYVSRVCATANQCLWHPAVLAAWIHVAIAAIHPFPDGNGRTARVLASLAMYRSGFKSQTFTSLEEWWGKYPDRYYESFQCLGSKFDPSTDTSEFVGNHMIQHLSQIVGLDARNRAHAILWLAFENLLLDENLPDRMAYALWDAFHDRTVTSLVYRSNADIAAPTATSDFRVACAAGFLAARGAGRGRHYVLGQRLLPALASELAVPYTGASDQEIRLAIGDKLSDRIRAEIDTGLESTSTELR